MKCPVCKRADLETKEIEPNLFAETCGNCKGKWITSDNYEQWLKHHGKILPEIPGQGSNMTIPEFELARLCPKDGRILIKYKVGRNIPFKLDRCGNCGGVWLDKDEWEVLKSRNLHDELNQIFTKNWQEQVAQDQIGKNLENIYREKFGVENYEKIKSFKTWIDQHEKQAEILAYLRDPNPLQL